MVRGVTQPEAGSREDLSQRGSEELGLHRRQAGKQRGQDAQRAATQRPWWLPCDGKEKPNLAAMEGSRILAEGPLWPKTQVIPSRAALALSRPRGHGREGRRRAGKRKEWRKEEGTRVGGRVP